MLVAKRHSLARPRGEPVISRCLADFSREVAAEIVKPAEGSWKIASSHDKYSVEVDRKQF